MEETNRTPEFCKSALTLLGLKVSEESSGVVSVEIPSSRLDLFDGRTALRLVFDPADALDDTELVVSGSYILERLLEIVRERGTLTHLEVHQTVQNPPPPRVNFANAESKLVSSEICRQAILIANFKVSLVSDEDQDCIFTAAVDLKSGVLLDPSTLQLAGCTGIADNSTDAVPDLSSGFDAARQAAERYAGTWASSAQADADHRLGTEVERLDTYYKDLLTDSTGRERSGIKKVQRERNKLAAECVKVEKSFNAAKALLEQVATEADLDTLLADLAREKRKLYFSLSKNFSSELDELKKKEDGVKQAADLVRQIVRGFPLERHMHELELVKQHTIAGLQKSLEDSGCMETEEQSISAVENINSQLSDEKAQRIEELTDKFQIKMVVTPISTALIRYPTAHFDFRAVSGDIVIPFDAVHDLVTDKVDLPACACCGIDMSTVYACSCGHLTCTDCRKSCVVCGTLLCSTCVKTACQICGGMLCANCVSKCDGCGKVICPTHSSQCKTCGQTLCKSEGIASCSRTCVLCGEDFCSKHSEYCPICHSPVCLDSMTKCSVCGLKGCGIDITECASCAKPVCPAHGSPCKFCGQRMCRECTDAAGCCSTCTGLFPATVSATAVEQIVSELTGSDTVNGRRWLIGESESQFVLAQKSLRMTVYVIDKRTRKVTTEHRLSIWNSLMHNLRIRA